MTDRYAFSSEKMNYKLFHIQCYHKVRPGKFFIFYNVSTPEKVAGTIRSADLGIRY